MKTKKLNSIACERCPRGRVMFDGEELACVQCGWRLAADRDNERAARPMAA